MRPGPTNIGDTVACLQQANNTFKDAFGPIHGRDVVRYFVPGRIEVLGKHTDYAGGRSLLAATSCGVVVISAGNGTNQVRMANADPRFPKASFPLSVEIDIPIGPWTNYPMTVARRLARNFAGDTNLQGVDIAFASDLPGASGMSSSSAMVVASYFAIAEPNRLAELPKYKANIQTPEDLAMYLACNENGRSFRALDGDRGVGTFGGSEDHTAILCCQPGRLSNYSFCPTRFERHVPFPDDFVFVVCHSGVTAEKTGQALEKYNAVSARARKACAVYNAHYRTQHETLADIVRENTSLGCPAMLDKFGAIPHRVDSTEALLDRFFQFVTESEEIIPRASDALAKGNLEEFGKWVDMSHENSRRLLWNIVPEIDFLQQNARALGAIAASGFGAGFGGSAYAVVHRGEADRFSRAWQEHYLAKFPQYRGHARCLTTCPTGAAHRMELA